MGVKRRLRVVILILALVWSFMTLTMLVFGIKPFIEQVLVFIGLALLAQALD